MTAPIETTVTLEHIAERLEELAPAAPLDHKGLQERGYTDHEARALLRTHGVRVPGGRRRRISPSMLARIERGEIPG